MPVRIFELEPATDRPSALLRCLLHSTEQPGLELEGRILEHQFTCRPGYLLFITENCPYEESLRVYLLSPALMVLDRLELSAPYCPGTLVEVSLRAEDAVEFSFPGGQRWRLVVRDHPGRSFTGLAPKRWLEIEPATDR